MMAAPEETVATVPKARRARAALAQLNSANGLSTLDTDFADPDMEALRQKVNEMILNGRR